MNISKEDFNKKFGKITMKMTGEFYVVSSNQSRNLVSHKFIDEEDGTKFIQFRGRSKEGRIIAYVKPEKIKNTIYADVGELLKSLDYDIAQCVYYGYGNVEMNKYIYYYKKK